MLEQQTVIHGIGMVVVGFYTLFHRQMRLIFVIAVFGNDADVFITNLIAQEDAYVLEINSDNLRESGRVQLRLRLKVSDYGQLSTLLGKLDALPGVDDARRLG